MQDSKMSRIIQTLSGQLIRSAIFFRNLWYAVRWFQRNKQYRNGIGEVVDGMSLPSGRLITNVTGIPDIAWYLVSGKLSSEDVIEILSKNGIVLGSLKSVLDFGCGCARVTRHMFKLNGSGIFGVDVDAKAIEWCQQYLGFDHFKICTQLPVLDYPDSNFDLVYALSVFTHLKTKLVLQWLRELRRVIRPGGYLIFTTMGENFMKSMNNAERDQFLRGAPVVKSATYSGDNLCRAYHPYEFVSKQFIDGFTIVDFSPGAAKGNPGQDLYLFRKN